MRWASFGSKSILADWVGWIVQGDWVDFVGVRRGWGLTGDFAKIWWLGWESGRALPDAHSCGETA